MKHFWSQIVPGHKSKHYVVTNRAAVTNWSESQIVPSHNSFIITYVNWIIASGCVVTGHRQTSIKPWKQMISLIRIDSLCIYHYTIENKHIARSTARYHNVNWFNQNRHLMKNISSYTSAHTVQNDSEYRLFGTSTLLPLIIHFYHLRCREQVEIRHYMDTMCWLSNILSLYISLLWSTLWHVN